MSFLKSLFGDDNERSISKMRGILNEVNKEGDRVKQLSDDEIKQDINSLKDRYKKGDDINSLLVPSFALTREVADRTLKERHFDVQILGGIAMHNGEIVEMRTGEGKTLVATLPASLNALTSKGVHIVTVNDYLARRDAVWMGQIFAGLGLSVGVINDGESYLYDPGHKEVDYDRDTLGSFKIFYEFLRPVDRKESYNADILYGTNNQFAFDYLKDNIAYSIDEIRGRGFNYAIVDEVDSILIDEARTPLIISTPMEQGASFYSTFSAIVNRMKEGEDYKVDEKLKAISLTDSGIKIAEDALNIENLYTKEGVKSVHYLENAIKASALYKKDKDYVIRDGDAVIVDEFTGRLQPGRRWSDGLHQAIEAKEKLEVRKESRTFASITFQNFFRMYEKLSGMTGTGKTSEEEFYKVYGLPVTIIPTNRNVKRKDYPDLIYKNEDGKYRAIAKKVSEVSKGGQPVLIGTTSIEKNELLSSYLKKEKVSHEVLNAKNHEREGEIIAQAGKRGAVTIATNLAGRGVDIKLGGIPSSDDKKNDIKDLGGLFVLGTERHEARRIDDQLRGRSGRQGDPGETIFFVSLEDQLMRIFGGDRIKSFMEKLSIPDDAPIESGMLTKSIEGAQRKIEGHYFDSRRNVLQYDQVLDRHRSQIYDKRREILFGGADKINKWVDTHKGYFDDLEELVNFIKEELNDDDKWLSEIKLLILRAIDVSWIEHLELMDYARGSVGLRQEPIVEYKREASELFISFESSVVSRVHTSLSVNKERMKRK